MTSATNDDDTRRNDDDTQQEQEKEQQQRERQHRTHLGLSASDPFRLKREQQRFLATITTSAPSAPPPHYHHYCHLISTKTEPFGFKLEHIPAVVLAEVSRCHRSMASVYGASSTAPSVSSAQDAEVVGTAAGTVSWPTCRQDISRSAVAPMSSVLACRFRGHAGSWSWNMSWNQ